MRVRATGGASSVRQRQALSPTLSIVLRVLAALFVVIATVSVSDPAFGAAAPGSTEEQTDDATGAVDGIIAQGALDAMHWALRFLNIDSSPAISQGAGGWFGPQYDMMVAVAVWVLLPLLFVSIIHAIAKGSLNQLLKSVLVFLPISILGAAAAVQIVQLLLDVTDDFSRAFLNNTQANADAFFTNVESGFLESVVSFWVSIILAVALMIVCALVYIVLVLREASIYIATSFLPIGFAMLVWPSTTRYFRKMVEFLFAMIFSKVVMVAGISLAVASIAGVAGLGSGASLQVGQGDPVGGGTAVDDSQAMWPWLGAVVEAIAMFGLVAFAPTMLYRFTTNLAVGGDVAQAITDHSNRPGAVQQVLMFDRIRGIGTNLKTISHRKDQIKSGQAAMANRSQAGEALAAIGVHRSQATGNYFINDNQLDRNGVTDPALRAEIMRLSRTQNANEQALAHAALAQGATLRAIDSSPGAMRLESEVSDGRGGLVRDHVHVLDVVDPSGNAIDQSPATLERLAVDSARGGAGQVRFVVANQTPAMQKAAERAAQRTGVSVDIVENRGAIDQNLAPV